MPNKYNQAGGTSEQQQCQNTCGVLDPVTGVTTRQDTNGVPFDVYWKKQGESYFCTQGMGKCFSCPHLMAFFATNP